MSADHEIPAEARCISQMPPVLPDGFLRGKFDNFCIDCKDCEAAAADSNGDLRSCYERSLEHWYTPKARTSYSENCAGCGVEIPEKTWALVQKFYVWPDSEDEAETSSADASDRLRRHIAMRGHRNCPRRSAGLIGAISAPKHDGDSE